MRARFAMVLVVGVLAPSPALAQADAYLDAGAAELVRLARERRNTVDRSITRYTTVVQERMTGGLRTPAWDRLLYRRETAGRIDWRRGGPIRIEVLGAREVIPAAIRNVQVPNDLRGFMPHLAFDPMDSELLVRFDTTFLRHPLAADGERHYRFRSGDTTTIRLPDGRDIRLLELVVIPRRDDVHLLTGSFWMDAATHAVVRVVFRPARPFDLARDGDDDDDVPAIIQPVRAELQYITLEYGLWDLRWWLPRLVAAEGVLQVSVMTMPLHYERRYSEYVVEGDTAVRPVPIDSLENRPCRAGFTMSIEVGRDMPDSTRARLRAEAEERARVRRAERAARNPSPRTDSILAERERCRQMFEVELPEDQSALLESEYLPADVWAGGAQLITVGELENLGDVLKRLPDAPWQASPPTFSWGLGAPGLRYNRVEALSIGAETSFDLGRVSLELTGRIGIADTEPNGELSIARETPGMQWRVSGYRRLAAAYPVTRPLGTGNSMSALFLGRDDGEYFRAAGGEFVLSPGLAANQWATLRLYGERQWRADVETDWSVRHALNGEHVFRPNLRARDADQFGAQLTLRRAGSRNPLAFRWGAELSTQAATGTYDFARPRLTLRATTPLPAGLLAGLEVAGGTSTGDVPVQSHFFLGGPATLRGYGGAVLHGDAFWRSRIDLSTQTPAARLVLFSDAGWAGARDDFTKGRALLSAGVGASFLDGIVRLDLARAMRGPTGWRLDFHVTGTM